MSSWATAARRPNHEESRKRIGKLLCLHSSPFVCCCKSSEGEVCLFNNVTANEAQTRALQIDPQLRAGDWRLTDRTQIRLEVPVDGYDAEPWNGVTDYCLYEASGNVLAVVEAK